MCIFIYVRSPLGGNLSIKQMEPDEYVRISWISYLLIIALLYKGRHTVFFSGLTNKGVERVNPHDR